MLATALTGCAFVSESEDTRQIVIAADLELSGAAATVGKGYQRALELKIEQLNGSGLLGARSIRLTVKDNRSDPSESLRNIGEFANDPRVSAIIMGSCSDCAVGAARTVNERRVPTIALALSTAVASPIADRRYMFKVAPNAADSAAAIANELRRQNIDRASLLHTDDGYGLDGLEAMSAELTKAGILLVGTKQVRTTDTDVSQAVAALAEPEQPGALLVWTAAEQAALTAITASEVGYPGSIYFDAAAAGNLFLSGETAKGADGVNLVFTQTMVIDEVVATTPAKAARKQWFRDYTARFGGYYGFSSFAADAAQLIASAATSQAGGGTVDRERIREVLETTQLDGLSGPIRMTPDNHSGLMPQALTMLISRDGRWRLAS